MNRFPIAAFVAAAVLAVGAVALASCGGSSNSSKIAKDVTSTTGQGASSSSLFKESNLSSAIKTFTSKFGTGPVQDFKIEPGAIKAVSSSGVEIVGADGATQGLKSPVTIPNIGGGSGIKPGDIDAGAPEKILASLKSKGVTAANTNYFLVSSALSTVTDNGATGWLIYTDKGNFQAKPDGSDAKTLGSSISTTITGGSTSAKKAESEAKKAAKQAEQQGQAIQKQAQSVQDCIAKAGTDPQKLAACAGQ